MAIFPLSYTVLCGIFALQSIEMKFWELLDFQHFSALRLNIMLMLIHVAYFVGTYSNAVLGVSLLRGSRVRHWDGLVMLSVLIDVFITYVTVLRILAVLGYPIIPPQN